MNRNQRDRKEELRRLRMVYSLGDFQLALSAADFLGEADSDKRYTTIELRRFRCYETTMVMAYTRPFSQSKDGVPNLSLRMCGVTLTEKQNALHERLKELRNKVAAHSDAEMMRVASYIHGIPIGDGNEYLAPLPVFSDGLEFHDFRTQCDVIELIRTVYCGLYKKISDQAQTNPELFNFRRDYLYPSD